MNVNCHWAYMYIEDKQVIRVNLSYHACVETWEESGLLTMCVTGDDALVMLLLSLRSSAMQHHQDRDNTFTYPLHIFISLLSYWASLQAGDLLYHAPVVLLFCCVRAASQLAAQVDLKFACLCFAFDGYISRHKDAACFSLSNDSAVLVVIARLAVMKKIAQPTRGCGHSIECITHAGRAAPSRWAASKRSQTAPHGCLVVIFLHFLTLWPWPLNFWPNINWWARYRDGLSLCKVWQF